MPEEPGKTSLDLIQFRLPPRTRGNRNDIENLRFSEDFCTDTIF